MLIGCLMLVLMLVLMTEILTGEMLTVSGWAYCHLLLPTLRRRQQLQQLQPILGRGRRPYQVAFRTQVVKVRIWGVDCIFYPLSS